MSTLDLGVFQGVWSNIPNSSMVSANITAGTLTESTRHNEQFIKFNFQIDVVDKLNRAALNLQVTFGSRWTSTFH